MSVQIWSDPDHSWTDGTETFSSGNVPREPSWCSACAKLGGEGDGPCPDHRGPDGKPRRYEGPDAYEPSAWVTEVVGAHFNAWDGDLYRCTGYDPRAGFWMLSIRGERVGRIANVSERAIGNTYRRARTS